MSHVTLKGIMGLAKCHKMWHEALSSNFSQNVKMAQGGRLWQVSQNDGIFDKETKRVEKGFSQVSLWFI